ncbi:MULTISPECIES: nickel-dependent hydrogenase large subunit [unclassified Dehalobacter]|uniref:hydrogenase large subunit n=1 Tax=unclassified Dehalobacter TaxID=2635733 RepID=UPI0003788DF3|nr:MULTISPECIES: nickel-dependent hydrogenase large subunit [unclassified Dehalobacter]RJE46705.1 NADH dehydrogenase [Dehalobacter sp. MCB1]TCX49334.1 NADH-quinone oxidoreductase subunit D [Dehalobacter sp. 14DCB1]TCX49914.1 NADH-quinone oxidoreductase subunit D [Dehalobacter sp. 12DCB1]
MGERTIIPFGPQHPVLPEPLHLDLIMEDEKVVGAVPSIGFVHRGLEKLVEKRDFNEMIYVIERICGICSFIHGQAYAQTLEGMMGVDIPPRAKYLRTIWAELSRVHSHLLWLGLMADGYGFESLFMHCWRIREKVLDIFEETTGGRVIFSVCKIGGVWKDIDNDTLNRIKRIIKDIGEEAKAVTDVFVRDYSVQKRTRGIGVLTYQEAIDLGAVGPTLRGSGVVEDMRTLGYAAYGDLNFEPIVEKDGDCYARTVVRVRELYQSLDLIRQCIEKIPDGEVDMKVKGNPNGEYIARLEQPRGQAFYYAKGNGTKYLDRFRVRTPTFANIPALLKILPGADLADVPVLALTIDPCISCTER